MAVKHFSKTSFRRLNGNAMDALGPQSANLMEDALAAAVRLRYQRQWKSRVFFAKVPKPSHSSILRELG